MVTILALFSKFWIKIKTQIKIKGPKFGGQKLPVFFFYNNLYKINFQYPGFD